MRPSGIGLELVAATADLSALVLLKVGRTLPDYRGSWCSQTGRVGVLSWCGKTGPFPVN